MSRLLSWVLVFLMCFCTAALSARFSKTGGQRSGRFAAVQPSIEGLNPLTKRLRKVGNLPAHDEDETSWFSCQFVNDNVGWLRINGKLWRTNDGGANWKLIYSNASVHIFGSGSIGHLQFMSPTRGWMLVDDKLYRTDDGGDTWQPLSAPQMQYVETFDFLADGKTGWLGGTVCEAFRTDEDAANRFRCGNDLMHGALASMFVTHDGGQTWQRQQVTRRFGDIHSIDMRDTNHGLAIGQGGVFHYEHGQWLDAVSTAPKIEDDHDPGWTPGEYCLQVEIGMPTVCPFVSYFIDGTHGYLSNTDGYLGRTNDGGRTWMDITHCEVEGRNLDAPYFSSFVIGLEGDGIALVSNGSLQETLDGGVTWAQLTDRDAFLDLYALSPGRVWLISHDGIYRLQF